MSENCTIGRAYPNPIIKNGDREFNKFEFDYTLIRMRLYPDIHDFQREGIDGLDNAEYYKPSRLSWSAVYQTWLVLYKRRTVF